MSSRGRLPPGAAAAASRVHAGRSALSSCPVAVHSGHGCAADRAHRCGCCRIGTEHEKLGYNMADTRRLTYEQIAALLTRIQASWRCCLRLGGRRREGDRRGLEAGSGRVWHLPRQLCAGLQQRRHSLGAPSECIHWPDPSFCPALQERFGWQPIIEGGNIIGLTQDGQVGAPPAAQPGRQAWRRLDGWLLRSAPGPALLRTKELGCTAVRVCGLTLCCAALCWVRCAERDAGAGRPV